MIYTILIGLSLTLATVGIHAVGTERLIRQLRKRESEHFSPVQRLDGVKLLCTTAGQLLLLHVLEVIVWAIAYLLIVDIDALEDIEAAIYFSMVTFTSLGYGDIVIGEPWRILCGIQAMGGLLLFGWSTALLFAVVRALWLTEDE